MRRASFYVLLGAAIVLVAGAAFAVLSDSRTAAPSAPERVFPGLADRLDNLAWIRLTRGPVKIGFANVAGRWVLVEKGNYPVSAARIRRLFDALADLSIVEPKTARPERFGRLGLDDPASGSSTLITLRGRTGNTIGELIVGRTRQDWLGGGADGVYVRKPGAGERAWLARGALDLPDDGVLWLDRGIVDIPPARISSVALTGGDGAALVLRRDGPGGGFALANLPEGLRLRADAALADSAGALAGLDFDDVMPAAELDQPESGVATAAFTTFDGLAITLRLVEAAGRDWVAAAASDRSAGAAESAAINARTARWVYAIPAARARLLRMRLADLTEPAKGS